MFESSLSRPPLVDLLYEGGDVLDRFLLEYTQPMALAHLLVVRRVDEVDDLPRAEERRGEKDRVLALFGHGGSPQEFAVEMGG